MELGKVDGIELGDSLIERVFLGSDLVYLAQDHSMVAGYSSTEFIVPEYVTEIHVTMVGGGGSGAVGSQHTDSGGGFAGECVKFVMDVTPGETIPLSVGVGGVGRSADSGYTLPGLPGEDTTFGTHTALGGAGGTENGTSYAGVGGTRTICDVQEVDGTQSGASGEGKVAYGGQASRFRYGGNGDYSADDYAYGTNGAYGSGGGAANVESTAGTAYSGYGGDGAIFIEWGTKL